MTGLLKTCLKPESSPVKSRWKYSSVLSACGNWLFLPDGCSRSARPGYIPWRERAAAAAAERPRWQTRLAGSYGGHQKPISWSWTEYSIPI